MQEASLERLLGQDMQGKFLTLCLVNYVIAVICKKLFKIPILVRTNTAYKQGTQHQ